MGWTAPRPPAAERLEPGTCRPSARRGRGGGRETSGRGAAAIAQVPLPPPPFSACPGHVPAGIPRTDTSLCGRRLPEPSLRRRTLAALSAGLREPPPHAALRPPARAVRQRPLAPRPRVPRALREPLAGGADPAQAAERQSPVPGSVRRLVPGRGASAPAAAAQALARRLPEALPVVKGGVRLLCPGCRPSWELPYPHGVSRHTDREKECSIKKN
ncbi:M-phase-specific PLK1-interacting protein isoform X1 [Agelaius tricolor]|uniref:M-phase-specific PLK1-interacting protein isoform X1 n=1 Tax=Agelaius tricolor TaxID=9191 RepID=UPI0039F1F062